MKRLQRILRVICLIAIGFALLPSICGGGVEAAAAKKQRIVNQADKIMLDSLRKLSGMAYNKGDYSETIRIKQEEESMVARMYGKTSDEYAQLMMEMSSVYYAQCSNDNPGKEQLIGHAMDYMKKCMAIYRKLHGMSSSEYIGAASSYAIILTEADAKKYAKEILEVRRNNISSFIANGDTAKLGFENYAYGYNCCLAADAEPDMEGKIRLLRDGMEAISVLPEERWYQGTRELVAEMYRRSGSIYSDMGRAASTNDIRQQLQYEIEANNLFAKGEKYGLNPVSRAYSDIIVANLYANNGDFGKAVEVLTALAGRVEASGTNYLGENLADVYVGLGRVYDAKGDVDKSMEAYNKALEICGEPSKENAMILSNIYYQLVGSLISHGKIVEGESLLGDWQQVLNDRLAPDGMEYASYLVRKARLEGVKGDVKQAFADSRQAYDITRRFFPADDIVAINVEKDMFQYSSVSHSNEWPLFFDRLLEHSSKYKIQNPNMYASILIDGARAYRNSGQYLKALELTDEVIGICNSIPHGVNTHILGYQQRKAMLLADMHRNEEAISILDSIISNPAANRVVKKSSYKTRAEVLKSTGDYAEALADFRKSESFAEKGEAGDSQYNLSSLGFVASLYENMFLSDSAYLTRGKAADMAARLYGEGSSQHLDAQIKKHLTWRHENIQKVDSLMRRSLLILEADSAASPYNYYIECMNYGDTRVHLGDLKGAAKYIRKALDGMDRLNSMEDESYHSMLTKGANIYFRMGDLETSSELAEKSLELTRRYHPYNLSRQLTALSWLIAADEKNTDYGSQLARHNEYVDLWNRQYGRDVFSDMGHNLAAGVIYSNLGDYGKMVEANERSLNVIDSLGIKESKEELHILSNLTVGMTPERIGDNAKLKLYADRLARCVDVQMKEEENRKGDSGDGAEPIYIMGRPDTFAEDMQTAVSVTLHNLSNAYYCLRDTAKCIGYGEAFLQRPQMDKELMVKGKSRQGLHLVRMGKADAGRRLLDEALSMADTLFKEKSAGNYLYVMYDNIRGYDGLGYKDRRNDMALEYGRHIRQYVSDSFLTLTSAGRTSFWNIYSPFLMDMFHGYVAEKGDTAMTRAGYDNLLLGKGLLLDTDRTIRQIVARSNDPRIKETYESYKLNRLTLDRYSKGGALLPLDLDSLARVVDNQEMYLANNSGGNSENFNIGWRDVRKSLKSREVAVEFAEYHDMTDTMGNRHYMAYILRRDMESPEAVALTIPEASLKQRHNFPGLSEALWKPIEHYMDGATAVYFSPAGSLHRIPVETLPDYSAEGKSIGDRWKLYRVSSTRNVIGRGKRRIKDAVIYGGLKYDTDIASLQSDSERYGRETGSVRNLEWFFEGEYQGTDTVMRRGVAYLPGTLAEANDIQGILADRKVTTSMYIGSEGTEASFKALTGTSHDIIHIATHGFSLEEEKSRSGVGRLLIGDADGATKSYEDRLMARSGLMMAGANNRLKRREIPENVDDGILHSGEIAGMDLRNVDMVIMSACETGLGRTENEGVYGLQRAFKKAGVNTLMVSLWPVNDAATSLLMKKFYEYLMQGKSKYESLANAQKFLREETKYTQPRYWSAFILIDGLN